MNSVGFEIQVKRNNIGRMVLIQICGEPGVLAGNVIDLVHGTDRPKRVRIQHGDPDRKGSVVQPHEYHLVGYANEEED